MVIDTKKVTAEVKQEDWEILNSDPLVKTWYGREFKIPKIKWRNWEKFEIQMAHFLLMYHAVCDMSKLPDRLNEIPQFIPNFRAVIRDKNSFNRLMKMAKMSDMDVKFIKKNFTLDDLIELFLYMYLVNIQSVKLNCKNALRMMGIAT